MRINYEGFQDEIIVTGVVEDEEFWALSFKGSGWSLDKKYGREPKVGDAMRLRMVQGSKVVGCIINGELLYDKTDEEVEAEHVAMVAKMKADRRADFEKSKGDLDKSYDALPPLFQIRLDKFRENNPDFRWEYEGYEMFCCEEAVKIANALGAKGRHGLAEGDSLEDLFKRFQDMSFAEQTKLTGISDGHSGNTFGTAVRLAYLYLTTPENVPKLHGALAPLVGSKEYGCVPKVAPQEDMGAAECD